MAPEVPDVLVVARKPGNGKVLREALVAEGFAAIVVADEAELVAALRADNLPRLALVDSSGFGRSVWHWCEWLRAESVPLVVISAPDVPNPQKAFHASGATPMLTKPVRKSALLALVRDLLGPADASSGRGE